ALLRSVQRLDQFAQVLDGLLVLVGGEGAVGAERAHRDRPVLEDRRGVGVLLGLRDAHRVAGGARPRVALVGAVLLGVVDREQRAGALLGPARLGGGRAARG